MIEFRTLRTEELPQWYAHCHSVFKLDDPEYFQRHYQYDPHADTSMIFVAMDGEKIASTIRVFVRRMYLLGRLVPAGGIGEVSTQPEYRRQGLAGRLLDMAIEEMARRGMEITTLFGNKHLYTEKGWRFCQFKTRMMDIASLPPLAQGLSIRPFQANDLPTVMGLYDLYAGRLNGAVSRTEAYWQRWVLPQWQAPEMLIRDGRPVAYTIVQAGKDGSGTVKELCAAPDAGPLLVSFLRQIAEPAGIQHLSCMASLLPEDAPGNVESIPSHLMVRSLRPIQGIEDSDALAAIMSEKGAGTFSVDWF